MNNLDNTIILSRYDYWRMVAENKGLFNAETDTMDHWIDFSLHPQSEDDIRKVAIYNEVNHLSVLCYSFVCSYSVLSEEFIEELIFITSPFFSFEYYNKRYINLVCSIVAKEPSFRRDYLEILARDKTLDKHFRHVADELSKKKNAITNLNKIDWYGIIFNQVDISDDFILTFKYDIDFRFLAKYFKLRLNRGGGGNISSILKELEKLQTKTE